MVGEGKRVLAVGGAGFIDRELSARGNRVTLLDADGPAVSAAAPYCEATIVADLDVSSLADLLVDQRFDAVVFCDVLEHLRDPVEALRAATSVLPGDGFAIVVTANAAHADVRLTHLRGFTSRGLRELCLRAGYRIDAIERVEAPSTTGADVLGGIRRDPEHDTLGFVVRAVSVSDAERLGLALDALAAAEARALEREAFARELEAERDELSRGFAAVVTAARSAESAAAAALGELRAETAALRASQARAQERARASGETASKVLAERERPAHDLDEAGAAAARAGPATAAQPAAHGHANDAHEAALTATLTELRQAFAIQERELIRIADERVEAAARAGAATIAVARTAEWIAAEAFDRSRLQNDLLSAARLTAERAQTELTARVAQAERTVAERDRALVSARVAQSHLAQALDELLQAVAHQFARRRAADALEDA